MRKFVVTANNSKTATFSCLATKRKDSYGSREYTMLRQGYHFRTPALAVKSWVKEKHKSQIDYVELRFALTG